MTVGVSPGTARTGERVGGGGCGKASCDLVRTKRGSAGQKNRARGDSVTLRSGRKEIRKNQENLSGYLCTGNSRPFVLKIIREVHVTGDGDEGSNGKECTRYRIIKSYYQ
jgi:hypothetical protein